MSLEEEIDKFHFEEENNPRAPLINISDAEGESDRNYGVYTPTLVIDRPNSFSEEEEDCIALNMGNKSLRDIMASRGKESTSKGASKSQVPSNLPPLPPQISTNFGLKPNLDLKKKRPFETLEEGEGVLERERNNRRWSQMLGTGDPSLWIAEKNKIELMCA